MLQSVRTYLETNGPVEASAPVRIDLGGTLDIPTLHYPLRHLRPVTFNAAIALRTRVRLQPFTDGRVKVSSRGFADAEFEPAKAPFDHPLGLMFAVAAYFGLSGLHIEIESSSPPRSALGGSSSAAVALVAACAALLSEDERGAGLGRQEAATLAHHVEAGVAGVPCGLQDQLAAAYGGIHAWHWHCGPEGTGFDGETLLAGDAVAWFEQRALLAYCGHPHESRNINSRWIAQFLEARTRSAWAEIVDCTRGFVDAMKKGDAAGGVDWMNREAALRLDMTPDVLDSQGERLCAAAAVAGCGSRFTGAGGGGCIWAFGPRAAIETLRPEWVARTESVASAAMLDVNVDTKGMLVNTKPTNS
jgi:D-glycero-alpha-D-manno-heptose-7-phosphate kinase